VNVNATIKSSVISCPLYPVLMYANGTLNIIVRITVIFSKPEYLPLYYNHIEFTTLVLERGCCIFNLGLIENDDHCRI
jgi:hypothetical protein